MAISYFPIKLSESEATEFVLLFLREHQEFYEPALIARPELRGHSERIIRSQFIWSAKQIMRADDHIEWRANPKRPGYFERCNDPKLLTRRSRNFANKARRKFERAGNIAGIALKNSTSSDERRAAEAMQIRCATSELAARRKANRKPRPKGL